MKKALAICLVLIMVFTLAACSGNGGNGDLPASSNTDLQHFSALAALPEFNGKGTIDGPGETTDYSYFWIMNTSLDEMKSYATRFEKDGWTLDDTIADYDAEAILYYSKGDDLVQLKMVQDSYIQVTVGTPEVVAGF